MLRVNLPILTRCVEKIDFKPVKAELNGLFTTLRKMRFDNFDSRFVSDVIQKSQVAVAELRSSRGEITQLLISKDSTLRTTNLPFMKSYLDLQIAMTINYLLLAPWNGGRFNEAVFADRRSASAGSVIGLDEIYTDLDVESFKKAWSDFRSKIEITPMVKIDTTLLNTATSLCSAFLTFLKVNSNNVEAMREEDLIINIFANMFKALQGVMAKTEQSTVGTAKTVTLPFILKHDNYVSTLTSLLLARAMEAFAEKQNKAFVVCQDDLFEVAAGNHCFFKASFLADYFERIYTSLTTDMFELSSQFDRDVKVIVQLPKYADLLIAACGYGLKNLTLDDRMLLAVVLDFSESRRLEISKTECKEQLEVFSSKFASAVSDVLSCIKYCYKGDGNPVINSFGGVAVMRNGRSYVVALEQSIINNDPVKMLRIIGQAKKNSKNYIRQASFVEYPSAQCLLPSLEQIPIDAQTSRILGIPVRQYFPNGFEFNKTDNTKYDCQVILKDDEADIREVFKRDSSFLQIDDNIEENLFDFLIRSEGGTILPPSEGADVVSFGRTNRRCANGAKYLVQPIDFNNADLVDVLLSFKLSILQSCSDQQLGDLYLSRVRQLCVAAHQVENYDIRTTKKYFLNLNLRDNECDIPIELLKAYSRDAARELLKLRNYSVVLPGGVYCDKTAKDLIRKGVDVPNVCTYNFTVPKRLMPDTADTISRTGKPVRAGLNMYGSYTVEISENKAQNELLDVIIRLTARDNLVASSKKIKLQDKYRFDKLFDNVALMSSKLNENFLLINSAGQLEYNKVFLNPIGFSQSKCTEANMIEWAKEVVKSSIVALDPSIQFISKAMKEGLVDLKIVKAGLTEMCSYLLERYSSDSTLFLFGCNHTVQELSDAVAGFEAATEDELLEKLKALADILDPSIDQSLRYFIYFTVNRVGVDQSNWIKTLSSKRVEYLRKPKIVERINTYGATAGIPEQIWKAMEKNILADLNDYDENVNEGDE